MSESTKGPTAGRRDLASLTDAELEEELLRRRRRRAQSRGLSPERAEPQGPSRQRPSPQRKQLSQYYANLELEPGASLDEVQRAYRRLMGQYHPDKHADDPERHRAATELAQSLTQAYHELSRLLGARRPSTQPSGSASSSPTRPETTGSGAAGPANAGRANAGPASQGSDADPASSKDGSSAQ